MKNGSNDKRLERLENLLAPPEKKGPPPIDPEDLAILNALETSVDCGPDDPRRREQFELTIARALEERGHSAAQIAETLAGWMATYDEFKEEGERQRRERKGGGGIGYGAL